MTIRPKIATDMKCWWTENLFSLRSWIHALRFERKLTKRGYKWEKSRGRKSLMKTSPTGETIHWADGFLLVYAITDRRSFNFVRRVKQMLCCDTPLALVGNKGDMVHLRQVSTEEGEILAKDYECWFSEVAAAEQVTQVAEAFHELCREVLSVRRKNKQSLLDRMLGNKSGWTESLFTWKE
ncbi:hypothetical protein L9F63_027070 [Diploptera punctata]|uniref:small monomeric GTPase n=1 Tax=Diploptera punctata TaxID=6984 RepID=A0AAD8ENW3_DIPPU|nr:hypothetical protein L9F63_027070 [Diploptera punctata]